MFATICSRMLSCYPCGKPHKVTFFTFSQCCGFRVLSVALCAYPMLHKSCHKWLCVTGAILLPVPLKSMFIFCGKRSASEWSVCVLHGRRSTLNVSCWSFCTALVVMRRGFKTTNRCLLFCRCWEGFERSLCVPADVLVPIGFARVSNKPVIPRMSDKSS